MEAFSFQPMPASTAFLALLVTPLTIVPALFGSEE